MIISLKSFISSVGFFFILRIITSEPVAYYLLLIIYNKEFIADDYKFYPERREAMLAEMQKVFHNSGVVARGEIVTPSGAKQGLGANFYRGVFGNNIATQGQQVEEALHFPLRART